MTYVANTVHYGPNTDYRFDEWMSAQFNPISTPSYIQEPLDFARKRIKDDKAVGGRAHPADVKLVNEIEAKLFEIRKFAYTTGALAGSGGFGKVFNTHRETNTNAVMKVQPRNDDDEDELIVDTTPREIFFLNLFSDEPWSPRLYDEFRFDDMQYIVMEKIEGKDLCKLRGDTQHLPIYAKRTWVFSIIKQMYEILTYLVSRKIHHGDLKLANIMLEKHTDKVYLVDYGFTYQGETGDVPRHATLDLGSPETKNIIYGRATHTGQDIWSFGVIVYTILHGFYPYAEASDGRYMDTSPTSDLEIDDEAGNLFTFLSRTLKKNPRARFTLAEIGEWINRTTVDDNPSDDDFLPDLDSLPMWSQSSSDELPSEGSSDWIPPPFLSIPSIAKSSWNPSDTGTSKRGRPSGLSSDYSSESGVAVSTSTSIGGSNSKGGRLKPVMITDDMLDYAPLVLDRTPGKRRRRDGDIQFGARIGQMMAIPRRLKKDWIPGWRNDRLVFAPTTLSLVQVGRDVFEGDVAYEELKRHEENSCTVSSNSIAIGVVVGVFSLAIIGGFGVLIHFTS